MLWSAVATVLIALAVLLLLQALDRPTCSITISGESIRVIGCSVPPEFWSDLKNLKALEAGLSFQSD
uniref:Movement protein TGBp3 n=1 Tax=Phyllanthus potexvirus 1 TaxID=2794412 RepID=A0A7T5QZ80_9VIRU|nr:TGB3 [Phyllanthus potexvirus 1]